MRNTWRDLDKSPNPSCVLFFFAITQYNSIGYSQRTHTHPSSKTKPANLWDWWSHHRCLAVDGNAAYHHYKRFDYPWWSNIVTENMGFHHRSAIVTFLLRHEDRHGTTVTKCHLWRSYENRHRMKHICDDLLTVIEVDLVTLSLSS